MEKLKLHSPDFTEENIARLAALFPNCVTEARDEKGVVKKSIDFDQLRQELSTSIVDGPQERYRLDWPGKREALLAANAPIAKTLRPCREESVDFETTKNLFIEGDNLDALKLLQETYLGKVKMIFIDPPYNTGKDFIYNDDFSENAGSYLERSNQQDETGNRMVANTESNGRFHSDWLSMIFPRLKLARNLLRDDGVIFISIDDVEQANLKKVCDEVFGGENFIGNLILQTATDNNQTQINTEHEYVICFSKNKSAQPFWARRSEAANLIMTEYERLKEELGNSPEIIQAQLRQWIKKNEKKLPKATHYDNVDKKGVYHDGDIANTKFGGYEFEVIHPKTNRPCKIPEKGFRFPPDTMRKMILEDEIVFGDDETTLIKPKKRLENVKDALRSLIYEDGRTSTKVVESLLGRDVFKNPKSHFILSRLIEFCTSENDLVVDFFAGSSSTAHAVMSLNSEVKSKRTFVMIQLPEPVDENDKESKQSFRFLKESNLNPTLAEVSKERIRRAGKKIKEENSGKEGIDQLDIGFRVLKIDSSNMESVFYAPDAVKQDDLFAHADNIRSGRTSEDLLFQVLLDWGAGLTWPINREKVNGKEVFFVDGVEGFDAKLAACFEGGIDEDFVKELAKRKPLRVVFKDSGFASDSVKINVEQIFNLVSPKTDIKVI